MTEWRQVDGFDYEVSEDGHIRKKGLLRERALLVSSAGYPTVSLYKEGVEYRFLVHRLVALAFIPNPDDKPQVNHKDGVRANSSRGNLEWVDVSENHTHAYRELNRHRYSKLTPDDVREIRHKYTLYGARQQKLAEEYNVSQGSISRILRGESWQHVK